MLSRIRQLLVVSFADAACGTGSEPVDPVWGKQACDSCRMLVSDPAYAAQLVDQRGARHFFDDVGCLTAYLAEHSANPPRALWVRSGERWVDAKSARYVSGAATPMDYGFVAQATGSLDFAAVQRAASAHRQEAHR